MDADSLSGVCNNTQHTYLISHVFLRVILWFVGIFALFGNLIVIFGELKVIPKMVDGPVPLRTNHVLILNLAVADLMMGVYLIMLGVAGLLLGGNEGYCLHKLEWISGPICTIMGVMVAISTECSVMTLVLLTSFRLYGVTQPFAASLNPRLSVVLVIIISTWSLSIFIAFVPLFPSLQSSFVKDAFIPNIPFLNHSSKSITFDFAKDWTEKFHPKSSNKSCPQTTTWDDLQNTLGENNKKFLKPLHFSGYYNSNSACLPRLFVTKAYKAWGFSLAISIFNFTCFVYIGIVYAFIMKTSRTLLERGKGACQVKPDGMLSEMQGKVLRLVVTNFLCWAPLSVRVFINFGGVSVSKDVYDVSAIILLPINSALNPIFYSSFVAKLCSCVIRRLFAHKKDGQLRHNAVLPMPERTNTNFVER